MRWAVLSAVMMAVVFGQQRQPAPAANPRRKVESRDQVLARTFADVWKRARNGAVWVKVNGRQVAGGAVVEKGWVATALSALGDAREFVVEDCAGNTAKAHLVGVDLLYDVALLKLDEDLKEAKPLPIGSEFLLRKGQFVFTIAPQKENFYVSVVSGVARNISRLSERALRRLKVMGILSDEFRGARRSYVGLIQHDGRMPPEDRGLPLVDSGGRMVGLNIELIFRGVALAAPASRIKETLPRLKKGYVLAAYPYLGFRGRTVREAEAPAKLRKDVAALRRKAEAPAGWGLKVVSLRKGGPAEKAGLKVGDIIFSVDYSPVWSLTDFRRRFMYMLPGMKVRLGIWRDGRKRNVVVEVGRREVGFLRLFLGKVDDRAAKPAIDEARRIFCAQSVKTLRDESGLTLLVETDVPRWALKQHLRFAKTALKNAR